METLEITKTDFSTALLLVKEGKTVTRSAWSRAGDVKITMKMQTPDINSKMTQPYLYMEKFYPAFDHEIIGATARLERFPLDLSAESIFATDWYEVK